MSPIKTGKKVSALWGPPTGDFCMLTVIQPIASIAIKRTKNVRVPNRTPRVHLPIRRCGQGNSLTPHRLWEHLRRQHPPDGSITDPIRRRKQIHTSKKHQLQPNILTKVSSISGDHPGAYPTAIHTAVGCEAQSPPKNITSSAMNRWEHPITIPPPSKIVKVSPHSAHIKVQCGSVTVITIWKQEKRMWVGTRTRTSQ